MTERCPWCGELRAVIESGHGYVTWLCPVDGYGREEVTSDAR